MTATKVTFEHFVRSLSDASVRHIAPIVRRSCYFNWRHCKVRPLFPVVRSRKFGQWGHRSISCWHLHLFSHPTMNESQFSSNIWYHFNQPINQLSLNAFRNIELQLTGDLCIIIQEAHQLLKSGKTLRRWTGTSVQTFRMSLVVILRRTVVKLFDSLPAGPAWCSFAEFSYILHPTGSS